MPFTPKFVDLVRNFTTVQGTGPVALGSAVSGYTSLAAAADTDDQFYYCIQSVDKPAEREVGRGTMQANGTIARQPISSGLTNFTPGTKTIALVTAAEWFSKLEGAGAAGGSIEAGSRAILAAKPTSLPALLIEADREGVFVFGTSNLSVQVAADPAQGIYVAPASDPTGASGAWGRRFDSEVSPLWFGVAPGTGNGAANSSAVNAMLACLRARASNVSTNYQGIEPIRFPAGYFELASTIELTDGTFRLRGAGSSIAGGQATQLKFPAGMTGIRVQRYNTQGASGTRSPTGRGGDASVISDLSLRGGYSTTEAEVHGIHLRARAIISDCYIAGFEGDGIHIWASTGGGAKEGNANLFAIRHCRCEGNRDGVFVRGDDANAGGGKFVDATGNRRWGINDESFLGNSWDSCHTETNGLVAGSIPTVVHHNGKRYGVISGQETGAATNAPSGTTADNSWWYHLGDGSENTGLNIPTWANGGTYRAGGSYQSSNINARTLFVGCYAEGGQGQAQVASPATVLGGFLSAGRVIGGGGMLCSELGALKSRGPFIVGGNLTVDAAASITGAFTANSGATTLGNQLISGNLSVYGSSISFGSTSGPIADTSVYFDCTNVANNITMRSWDAGVPRDDGSISTVRFGGLYLNGKNEIHFRSNGAEIGILNSGGFLITAPACGIGYGAGAGGSVSQSTSKSTAVTLNKASGQIVMHAAALAAATSVSFTLTNNVIAATDVIAVNVASAASANAYQVGVDAVAGGSCRIQVRNVSGGSLSEAPVLNFAVIKAAAA